jgi:hypothetical protein
MRRINRTMPADEMVRLKARPDRLKLEEQPRAQKVRSRRRNGSSRNCWRKSNFAAKLVRACCGTRPTRACATISNNTQYSERKIAGRSVPVPANTQTPSDEKLCWLVTRLVARG